MGYGEINKIPTELMGARESTENRLERRKKQLQEELQAVEDAIQLFKEHPYLSNALDLLGRIGI